MPSSAGERPSREQLELAYHELKRLALHHLRGERSDHTLQPTALVHEAWMRLEGQQGGAWKNQGHFLGVASLAMRRVLVDHARARKSDKRGGDARRTLWSDVFSSEGEIASAVDFIALDEALDELARQNERAAKVVELRFFAGLTEQEAADVLGVARSTVILDWRTAKAWLGLKLEAADG